MHLDASNLKHLPYIKETNSNKIYSEEIVEYGIGEAVFWLLALGAVVGWLAQSFMGKGQGFGLIPNLLAGAFGSLVIGLLAVNLDLPGSLLFGFLGCLSILFLANVFSVGDHHQKDVEISK